VAATYLVLDQELDTLNRSSGSLRDGGGDTTHCDSQSVRIHRDNEKDEIIADMVENFMLAVERGCIR